MLRVIVALKNIYINPQAREMVKISFMLCWQISISFMLTPCSHFMEILPPGFFVLPQQPWIDMCLSCVQLFFVQFCIFIIGKEFLCPVKKYFNFKNT